MKLLILSCLAALAVADVSHILGKYEKDATIKQQELDIGNEGAYQWGFETSNGIAINAKGEVPNFGAENPSQIAQGNAQWTAPGGEQISFQYIADENGYQPQGSHLPTPPPIPDYILRALEYIRDNPPAPEK